MARSPASPRGPKAKISVTVDPDLHAWLISKTGPGKEFSTVSHAVERGIALLLEIEQQGSSRGSDRKRN